MFLMYGLSAVAFGVIGFWACNILYPKHKGDAK